MQLLLCVLRKTPQIKKREIPSASVTGPKSKKSTQQSSIKTFLKKDLTSTDSNWNANTCGKSGNSSQHSYSISHGNSNPELVSCTPQGSYEIISQHSNFSNSKSGTSFSDTSLILSSPSKSVLTSKICDSSKSFKGPTLLHSKQSDNYNRYNVSYCNPRLTFPKAIDVNTGQLSETFVLVSNCNRYDVATYKAKAPYLSDAERKDWIKDVFVPDENFVFHEQKDVFDMNGLKSLHSYVIPLVKMLLTVYFLLCWL